MHKSGLVLEGGGIRGAYTAGALSWLMDQGLTLDYGVGVSSGAAYLALYMLGRKDVLYKMATDYTIRDEIVGLKAFRAEKHYVAYKRLFSHYLKEVEKVDVTPLRALGSRFEVGVYNLGLGYTEYYNGTAMNEEMDLVRASCALPIASSVVEVDGKRFLDGGITKMIPIERAVEVGCDRCLVITTKPKDYIRKPASKILEMMMKVNYRECPQVAKDYHIRHENYYKQIQLIRQMEEEGKALQIYPTRTIQVSRFKGDAEKCKELFALGYQDMEKRKEEIYAFVGKKND
ncbi:MAG: patatin family protein [Solobacterium sp.]|nr:patatin family protein [Solobacterium sp.]